MMSERKHSPLPWRVRECGCGQDCRSVILEGVLQSDGRYSKEDGEFIVRAVNSHYELIDALEGILEIGKRDMSNPKYDGYFEDARQALAKAKGEA